MNLEYKNLLPQDFSPASRVWIYQANRLFTMNEALQIEAILEEFLKKWHAHGDPVKGFATLFFGQFVVLMADETSTRVSGCSTDSSVAVIRQIEQAFQVSMFDRQTLAFVVKDKIQLLPLTHLKHALDNGFISSETLYFNNTILTKEELENKWIVLVKDSWLAKKISSAV